MIYKIYKLAELPDAEVPFNIMVGESWEGELHYPIVVGDSAYVGSLRTSPVVEIFDEFTFKTLNSIYKLIPENQIEKPSSFKLWQYNKKENVEANYSKDSIW